jgi:teichuronic acid biosynthesis glycosyltransferase TuaC
VRVLVVTHMWPNEATPHAGVFVRDQVRALRRLGEVEVDVARFPRGARGYVRAARALRRMSLERYDVVHAHYGLTGASAIAARRDRLVVTFHGTDLVHRFVGPLSRAVARSASLPATVSRSLARSALPGAGVRRRVAVLPCGVDIERFRPVDRRDARSRLGVPPDSRFLLFPADPARREKRHDRAQALAAGLGDTRLLTLRGVAPSEVPLWVNASDAVLVTSEREGFGLAALEALACDVPVLSTPVGIAPVALAGVAGALCEPYSEERWLGELRRHLASDDPRIEGRGRALMFSSERMACRVLVAYRELSPPTGPERATSARDAGGRVQLADGGQSGSRSARPSPSHPSPPPGRT